YTATITTGARTPPGARPASPSWGPAASVEGVALSQTAVTLDGSIVVEPSP
ncbi:MAG: hypothetical protein H6Q88_2164, partial [Anaeromyxobacteraceae bacterium]|nr:hypothetical protein [Anaeromyxobacteraceae bacterium]